MLSNVIYLALAKPYYSVYGPKPKGILDSWTCKYSLVLSRDDGPAQGPTETLIIENQHFEAYRFTILETWGKRAWLCPKSKKYLPASTSKAHWEADFFFYLWTEPHSSHLTECIYENANYFFKYLTCSIMNSSGLTCELVSSNLSASLYLSCLLVKVFAITSSTSDSR